LTGEITETEVSDEIYNANTDGGTTNMASDGSQTSGTDKKNVL
jgi:hypothetical protein